MGSAQLDFLPLESPASPEDPLAAASTLRSEAAQRLAEHRRRRAGNPAETSAPATPRERRRNPIAAAVAERYAQTPSYRAFLAEEAERAARRAHQQAEAAAAQAEIAARNAQAIAAVQQELLAELELWTAPQTFTPQTAAVTSAAVTSAEVAPYRSPAAQGMTAQPATDHQSTGHQATVPMTANHRPAELSFRSEAEESAGDLSFRSEAEESADDLSFRSEAEESAGPDATAPSTSLSHRPKRSAPATPSSTNPPPVRELSTAGLTVRLYEDLGRRPASVPAARAAVSLDDPEESLALDEEIAFRHSPEFEPFVIEPTTPLPANLLEFPRQLVASRKARPRLAEGPLLEETPRAPQLRIFEVEPEQISIQPPPPATTPDWLSIHLDATPKAHPVSLPEVDADLTSAHSPALLPPLPGIQTAPLGLRLMASVTDLLLVTASFLAFTATAAYLASAVPTGIPAAIAAAATLALFYVGYRILFFTFSDQTPGMRYARIGFCTLTDDNPSRRAIRRRLWAELIALIPFGLGFLWALLDDDHLGWHDRISRMYPRAY